MTECNWWLMKSEPEVYGIDHLQKEGTTLWDGIRNYQARNFMRSMKVGDKAFFYHSNCTNPCIAGIMEIEGINLVDPTQFKTSSKYFDPKSTREKPRWDCASVKYISEFTRKITLRELKDLYKEDELQILKRGNRLSITPVKKEIADDILRKVGFKQQ